MAAAAPRRPGRGTARDPRSPRPEVLPQPVRLRLGPGRRPVRLARRLPFARWGLAELQLMGWPLLALTRAGRAGGTGTWAWCPARAAGPGGLVLPRSAAARAAGAGPGASRRPTARSPRSRALEHDVYRRAGRADRHLPVDLQRPPEPLARPRPGDRPALLPGRVPQRPGPGERAAEREHVDRPGGGAAAAPPAGGAADRRGHRPADRLRAAARRGARPRARSSA